MLTKGLYSSILVFFCGKMLASSEVLGIWSKKKFVAQNQNNVQNDRHAPYD